MEVLLTLVPNVIAVALGLVAWYILLNSFHPIWPFTLWKRKTRKTPIKQKLLAYPGRTLDRKFQDLFFDFTSDGIVLVLGPGVAWFVYANIIRPPVGIHYSFFLFTASTLLGIAAGYLSLRRRVREMRNIRLGLDAERATGEELNQLMRDGFYVFHDFPAGNFNIDHVLIGPGGVFAVETKLRPKLMGKGADGATVHRDGETLRFPTHVDRNSIPQAERQARWLEKFLKGCVGKEVRVQAVLALPGWFIPPGPHDGKVLVISPTNPTALFTKRPVILDAQTINQIAFQVGNACRTIAPFDPY